MQKIKTHPKKSFILNVFIVLLLSVLLLFCLFAPKDLIYGNLESSQFTVIDKKLNEDKGIWNIKLISKSDNKTVSFSCYEEPKDNTPIILYQKKKASSFIGFFHPEYEFNENVVIANCFILKKEPLIGTKQISL